MAIDEVYKMAQLMPEELNTLQKIFANIHENAVGIQYTDTVPTKVPDGKLVVYDNGVTRRLYIKTGKGTIVYVALTA